MLGWAEGEGYENVWVPAGDGTRLRVVVGGPEGAPRVMFLHGAPQHAYAWRKVLGLVRGRVRFAAPDLRGYGMSDLGAGGRYDVGRLADDVDAVAGAVGFDGPFVLVGHDWGGVIAWHYAQTRPARLCHLVSVNGPHLGVYAREMRKPRQLWRSWYVLLLQLPGIDRLPARGRLAFAARLLRAMAPPGFFDEDLDVYVDALARPGRLEAATAYYQQAFRSGAGGASVAPPVAVPTTVVWGEDDKALDRGHPDAVAPFVKAMRVERLPGISHWVPEERPDAVAGAIAAALEMSAGGGRGSSLA